jgi:hypothetical protein
MLKVLTNSNAMLHICYIYIYYIYKGEMNYYSMVKKDSRLHK